MSSPFSFALAKLDGTLEVVLHQLDCLAAGRQVNEEELGKSLKEACHQSTLLRDLICAEHPGANWDDRAALGRVIAQLEAAANARRNQQRRTKLLELANELDAGTVKHRFEARSKTLNALRLDAVRELRREAAVSEQTKDLPGPNAGDWLNWACNLDDQQDAQVLANLRKDFVVLERFTAEMDAAYWVPGQRKPESPDPPPPGQAGAGPTVAAPTPVASARAGQQKPSENVSAHVQTALADGDSSEAATPAPTTSAAVASAPSLTEAIATAPHDESALRANEDATAEEMSRDGGPMISGIGPETSEAPVEQRSSEGREDLAGFDQPTVRHRPVLAWAGAAALVVVSLTIAVIYHVHAGIGSKTARPSASADAQVAAESPDPDTQSPSAPQTQPPQQAGAGTPSAGAAPAAGLLNKQPVEGPQGKILLSLENCDRVTADGIECWGYVSNLGSESSRVSLDRADVVDGNGNNFSVDKKDQLTFGTGHSLNLPAGSRAKYTLKVPDTDRDARTLTLYVDLSTPPSLEYTFRDVPVANN